MERLGMWWRRLRLLFGRERWDRDLEDEMRFHLEMQAQENRENGIDAEEARYSASRQLGNATVLREASRAEWGWTWVESVLQDVRYTVRSLDRTPGFTAVALATLALGIGANTAIFSLLHDMILERLPISHPEELVQLTWSSQRGSRGSNFNWPEFEPMLRPQPALPGLCAHLSQEVSLVADGTFERVRAHHVSGGYYSTLGVRAFLGRTLGAADDRPSAAPAAVLSYAYWQRRFARDPRILGRTVSLDGTPLTIVGVTPPEFYGVSRLTPPEITVPLDAVPLADGKSYYVFYFARLQPGVSPVQARAQVTMRMQGLLEAELKSERDWMGKMKLDVIPAATGEYDARWTLETSLRILWICIGIVLLICCTNLATLLLARSAVRSREIAARLVIGASRGRILRQLLTESVVLSMGGGSLGLATGYLVHRVLLILLSTDGPTTIEYRLHPPLLAFTAGVSVLIGILLGLAPALRAARINLSSAMRGDAPTTSGRLRLTPARWLLVAQVAASVVLLASATLFVRTLHNLKTIDAGFDRERLLLMSVDTRPARLDGERLLALLDDVMERVSAIPGVRSAALAQMEVYGRNAMKNIWGQGFVPQHGTVGFNMVGPGFFSNAGIPLVAGREFSSRDRAGAPLVAMVNEAFVRAHLPGGDPLGRRFGDRGPKSAGMFEIVGVVKDARHANLRLPPQPTVYQSLWQHARLPPFVLHVRTVRDPASLTAHLRREIQAANSALTIHHVRTMTEEVEGTLRQERTFATLLGWLGGLALGLCCVGLYGVASYSVTRRTKEIGLRMAIGAARGDILWLVLRETLGLVTIGSLLGAPLALVAARVIRRLLFGLTPADPWTVGTAVLLMAGIATIACLVPAYRAIRIHPTEALRYE